MKQTNYKSKDFNGLPLVSIVIPVFNGSNFLSDAIQSALDQDYKNIEIIVVNDGSDDNSKTDQIISKFRPYIRDFSKLNGGVASALNLAISAMNGSFFSWLSHDDLYKQNKISKNFDFYAQLENIDSVIYSNYAELFDSTGRIGEVVLENQSPEKFKYWLLRNSRLHGCSLFIPKHAFEKCGTFNENLITTQDYDLWLRMSESFDFVHIQESLVISRIHSVQDSVTSSILALKECNDLYYKYCSQLTESELVLGSGLPRSLARQDLIESLSNRGWHDAAYNLRMLFEVL